MIGERPVPVVKIRAVNGQEAEISKAAFELLENHRWFDVIVDGMKVMVLRKVDA